ncbi:MAG: type II secretion system protein [Planctomycetota bacterium]
MTHPRPRTSDAAFTLIELLVVIAIIGILVSVLIPSISVVRTKAKYTDANAQFNGITAGLEVFRGESALGSTYPPSTSDNNDPDLIKRLLIANPLKEDISVDTTITGAHLLVQALVGADFLGPPGFKDFDRNGLWSNDTHKKTPTGAYGIEPATGEIIHTRYGGPGKSYVDDKAKARIKSLNEMASLGHVAVLPPLAATDGSYDQPLFVDPWFRPILYYRANPSAQLISGLVDGTPGIYRAEDNALITGHMGTGGLGFEGVDFGAGRISMQLHAIGVSAYPKAIDDLTLPLYADSFAVFIRDKSVKAINQPVRKDSFLLISAGPDGRYGTDDDVTNWPRDDK